MTMMAGTLRIVLGMLLAAGLAGCYEDPGDVTLHEPGVYKGPVDPLLASLRTPALEQQLQDRFSLVQADR